MSDSYRGSGSAYSGVLLAGRYLLERLIGKGGMAEVWSAHDEELDRRVAVKWLKPSLAGDAVIAERFRREALAVAKLSHPNIVAIHDVIEHDGRQAVVMQLVDGKSLRVHLDKQKRLGPELTIHLGASVASALDCAHRANLVHRDVKPGNILLASDGRALLTDFGIAKALDGSEDDLTSDNVMMGTAKYLSPEQVRGKPLDGRADLYALGLVLYESLAGRVPFLGENDADTALARLQRDPTDLGHLRPTLPIGLVNLIHRTLARNPSHRPQTGAELRAALMAVDTTPPEIDHTPTELPDRHKNPPVRARGAGPGSAGVADSDQEDGRSGTTAMPSASQPGSSQPGSSQRSSHNNESSKNDRRSGSKAEREGVQPDAPVTEREPTPAPPEPLLGRQRKSGFYDQARDASGAFQQRLGPTRVVLLGVSALAVLVLIALLAINNRGERAEDLPTSSVVTTLAPLVDPDGPVTIGAFDAYDPDGDNGTENDEQAALAKADGQIATFWSTECYQNAYLGGKDGVGLIVSLTNKGSGTLTFDMLSAPYETVVYVAPTDEIPDDLTGWEIASDGFSGSDPETVTAEINQQARHLLIWVTRIGQDDACTSTNPYRGKVGEVTFSVDN